MAFAPEWKYWIAKNKLRNVPDKEIADALRQWGFNDRDIDEEMREIVSSPYFQAANNQGGMLNKWSSLANIRNSLIQLNIENFRIERRSGVSREEFLEKYYSANRPIIITDLMNEWTACTRWTAEYMKSVCGNMSVEIMANRNSNPRYEIEVKQHCRKIPFSQYVDMVENSSENNDFYMVARNNFFKSPETYKLLPDIKLFPQYLDTTNPESANMWYGPAGTVTPLHHDEMNIFMAQVQGSKRVKMIAPINLDRIYNEEGVYSPIDPENPDYKRFPKYRDVHVMEVDLMPGEVLFLPVGWWHHVRSLQKSITLTFTNFLFPNLFVWHHPSSAGPRY